MTQNDSNRDTVRFSVQLDPGETRELREEISRDATVEEVRIRFYRGPRHDVQVRPFVEDREERDRIVVPRLAGKEHIDGEDDDLAFAVSQPVEKDGYVGVELANQEDSYAYNINVDVVVDYGGGLRQSLRSMLRGGS